MGGAGGGVPTMYTIFQRQAAAQLGPNPCRFVLPLPARRRPSPNEKLDVTDPRETTSP